jgi:hypothetical protein
MASAPEFAKVEREINKSVMNDKILFFIVVDGLW